MHTDKAIAEFEACRAAIEAAGVTVRGEHEPVAIIQAPAGAGAEAPV